jgi:hypothetical protein
MTRKIEQPRSAPRWPIICICTVGARHSAIDCKSSIHTRLPARPRNCSDESYHALFIFPHSLVIPCSSSVQFSSVIPMSSSHNPASSNDAPRDEAPPPPPPQDQEPPQYSEQATIEPVAGEASSSSQANTETQPDSSAPARPGPKAEASSYAGSYRPSDAQSPTRSVSSLTATPRANTSKAHLQSLNLTMAPSSSSMSQKQKTPTYPHPHTLSFLDN